MMQFITGKTGLSNHLCIPRQVLSMELNGTELHLYALLLDRARLSQRSPAWADREGRVFVFYPIAQLAAHTDKGESTVKRALHRLEALGLLYRKRQGACRANQLYVRIPQEAPTPAPAPTVPAESGALPIPPADACEKRGGNPGEKEAFDRLLRQKRREWEAASVARQGHSAGYDGANGAW